MIRRVPPGGWLTVAECVGCGDPAPMGKPCPRCQTRARRGWKLEILGRPVSQKNSKEIRRRGRRGPRFVGSNEGVLAWKSSAIHQLQQQWHTNPIGPGQEVTLTVRAYLAKGQSMDSDGIASGPMDALEKAGVVANDQQFSPLHVYRVRDWENPRVEFYLEPRGGGR